MKYLNIPRLPAYIHIPKTGGTYLSQLEADRKAIISPLKYLGHVCIIQGSDPGGSVYPPKNGVVLTRKLEDVGKYYLFSTVRNPFEWLVSYASHAGGWNRRYYDSNHYDFKAANKGFDYLLNTIFDREDIWPNRKLLHFQIFSDKGRLIVDWINRNKTLDDDLSRLAGKLHLNYKLKERQRIGKHDDYRIYYNDKLIDLVYSVWRKDFILFGFDFEGCSIEKAMIKNEIAEDQKHSIKYTWHDDDLRIDQRKII